MIRKILLLALMCVASSPALAAYPWATNDLLTATDLNAAIAGAKEYKVITPTGVAATDLATFNAAFSSTPASTPVFMAAGDWAVCSPFVVPDGRTLWGAAANTNPGSSNWTGTGRQTYLSCGDTSGAGFPADNGDGTYAGYVRAGNNTIIRGLTIKGNLGDTKHVVCIDAHDVSGVDIGDNQIAFCDVGIARWRTGGGLSQNSWIHHNLIYGNVDFGIAANNSVSDEVWDGNWLMANGSGPTSQGQMYLPSYSSIINGRYEDGGGGIVCNGCVSVIFANNYLDRFSGYVFWATNSQFLNFSGNRWFGYADSFHTTPDSLMLLQGDTVGLTMDASNTFDGGGIAVFKNLGYIHRSHIAAIPKEVKPYFDTYTRTSMGPAMSAPIFGQSNFSVPLSSTTFQPDFTNASNNLVLIPNQGGPYTIGLPVPFEIGRRGTLTVINNPTGNAITFAAGYTGAPTIGATADQVFMIPYTVQGNNTVRLETTSGVASATNQLSGGNGMTSVWTTTQATLTTGGAGDPMGGSNVATLTENAANNDHTADNAFTMSTTTGVVTCSGFVKAGAGGSPRYVVVAVFTGSNGKVQMVFDPATGEPQYKPYFRGGVVPLDYGSTPFSNGWYRVWVTADITWSGSFPSAADLSFYLSKNPYPSSGSFAYAGDNTSNIKLSYPRCRDGALP